MIACMGINKMVDGVNKYILSLIAANFVCANYYGWFLHGAGVTYNTVTI